MKTFKITATAPTAYQYNSLAAFGMEIQKLGNGSMYSEKTFDSEEEAKQYLEGRAGMYYEEENELTEAIDDIRNYNILRIDAVSARIEEVEETEEA